VRRGARVVATVVDVVCMLPWIGVVAAAGAVLWSSGFTRSFDAGAANIVGFVTLIVPITLAASGFEGSARHATPGKRLLRFRVDRWSGGGAGFVRSLLRNGVKYAIPWELGHTAVFALFGSTTAPSTDTVVVLVGAYGIPLLSLALLLVNGTSLHDRIAGTRVVTEDPELAEVGDEQVEGPDRRRG
jgi:uncharacterized RDD family membrane protein YckC